MDLANLRLQKFPLRVVQGMRVVRVNQVVVGITLRGSCYCDPEVDLQAYRDSTFAHSAVTGLVKLGVVSDTQANDYFDRCEDQTLGRQAHFDLQRLYRMGKDWKLTLPDRAYTALHNALDLAPNQEALGR